MAVFFVSLPRIQRERSSRLKFRGQPSSQTVFHFVDRNEGEIGRVRFTVRKYSRN